MKSPHQLSPEALQEFNEIYTEEFGRTLSEEDAQQMAVDVLRLFDTLITPGNEPPDSHGRRAGVIELHSSVR